MTIQGMRTDGNWVADQRPQNWRQTMLLIYPNGKMPLTALTSLMKSQSTDDPQYNWWEKTFDAQRLQLTTGINTSVTNLAMTGGGALSVKAGSLLYAESSGEIMRVNTDPVSDTAIASVTRGVAGTTAATITLGTHNPYLLNLGTAYEEGSSAPTGVNFDPVKKYNYTQIFRDTLEMTRTASKTRLRTGDQIKEAKRECLELHGVGMERAFFFGNRQETTLNSKPIRYTGGVLSFVDAGNTKTFTAAVTMEDLENEIEKMFRFGSSEKLAFMGNRSLLTVQQVVRKNSHFQITSGIKEYGMNVSRLTSPFGELVMKTHPLFNTMSGGSLATFPTWDAGMIVLDMDYVKYRYFSGDDTRYEKDLQNNGVDGMKSGYISECGLEVQFPKAHYWIKGMYDAAVDA